MRAALVLALLLVAACKNQDAGASAPPSGAPAGTERGACYGNNTCNDGLVCLSDLCVRPPGADCAQVAEKLSYLMLGNYADRDARTAFLASTRDDCEAAHLTKDEGACLMSAPHRNALSQCPKVIGVGDCKKILAHLPDLTGQDQYQTTEADHVASRCKNETPSKAFELCALAAKDVKDLERCSW
jgi:hypothetical protein